MKPITLLVGSAAIVMAISCLRAADSRIPSASVVNVDAATRAQVLTAQRSALDSAKTLARANNVAAAEQAILQSNRAKPDTVAWRMESSQRLVQVAERLGRDGQAASAAPLVNSALQHLVTAEQSARLARTKATLKIQAAFIQERYLGDRQAAIASYEAALRLTYDARAKEALDRLKSTEENLRLKTATRR